MARVVGEIDLADAASFALADAASFDLAGAASLTYDFDIIENELENERVSVIAVATAVPGVLVNRQVPNTVEFAGGRKKRRRI